MIADMILTAPRLAIAAALACVSAPAAAQTQPTSTSSGQAYPNKPVRVIISSTAGSQPDSIIRVVAQKLSEKWGKAVVIDNRPGAGGVLAATAVAKATPDGYTLLYTLPNFAISSVLQQSVPYQLKEFAGITQIGFSTNVLVVTPTLGAKSVKELVAAAKAQPGKLILASSATGSASHLTGARFNYITGIKVVTVAYKGGPDATIEVLAGRAQYHVGTMGVVLPFVKEGKLLALGVTTPERSPVLPDVPTLGETLPEFKRPETSHAFLAPAGTPRAIVNQLNKDLVAALNHADVKDHLQRISFSAWTSTPEECIRILSDQIGTLGKLVVDAGLKPK